MKINDLIRVCQTHGMDISSLDNLEATSTIDLRLCAVLLRLADILDFDTSRAPQAVYEYSGFDKKEGDGPRLSKAEWEKHLSSFGFDFEHISDRSNPYLLDYSAESRSIQVEQVINSYLDWVDQELSDCSKNLARYVGKWQNLVLPMKVNRIIEPVGYVSGQYHLSLDHNKVMELLIGNDLYNDPAVFVRELLQNAIDAVRTREKMDKNLPADWKPQIKIRTWTDEEGDHWFRIEDNGIGMSEEIILNYLLKVGSSYYTSDLFEQDKIRCKVDPDYTPISRFGIGILSCFMGDKRVNQVEISTKRFHDSSENHSALRLSMHGMEGFYYMAKKDEGHVPGEMKGVTAEEQIPFLNHAGTVIAVRTNLYQMSNYKGFKR
ncbi:MAG: ATP-binding protein [Lachnospiraceae bacterium]|nr:ATP-binding protein [Lachnospiraceae bacterium]